MCLVLIFRCPRSQNFSEIMFFGWNSVRLKGSSIQSRFSEKYWERGYLKIRTKNISELMELYARMTYTSTPVSPTYPQSPLEESHAQDLFRGLGGQRNLFLEGHGVRFARVWGPKDTNIILETGGTAVCLYWMQLCWMWLFKHVPIDVKHVHRLRTTYWRERCNQ